MNIIFEQLELQNFKSVGDPIILDYQSLKGFNYIFGTNSDSADGASNGSGKCVHANTEIEIEIPDELLNDFKKLKNDDFPEPL